jgi:hypothetical protein
VARTEEKRRSRRSDLATFEEAKELVLEIVGDGRWHKSRVIHERLRPRMSEGMFLRVKKALRIEDRRVGGGPGSYYEWRLSRGLTPTERR